MAQHSGRDRWSLSRDFRQLFGTSPYRYLIMRRLDLVRTLLMQGQSLASAALIAGFVDQSHMTGHFTNTWGLPPLRWLKLQGARDLAETCTIVQESRHWFDYAGCF